LNLTATFQDHPGDAVAVISRGRTTDYATLRAQVAAYAGGLRALGLEPGDRLAIVAGTNWYFVVSYLATLHAGLVAVPINPSEPAAAVRRQLVETGARAVFIGPSARAALGGIEPDEAPSVEFAIVSDGAAGGERAPKVTYVDIDHLLAHEPIPVTERADDDVAVLVFTSGTAGSPKAAMLTHGSLRSNIEQVQAHPGRGLLADDVVLGVLPLSHIFGLNVVLGASLYAGARIVLIERFDPVSAMEAIANHKVTVVTGAPTMWSSWASLPDADPAAFATVRIAASGAAKLDPALVGVCRERFGIELSEGYGLTEASPVVTSAVGVEGHPGSIGLPLPGVEVRLVDADGTDTLVGDPGEIWVRGPNVFAGYWNDAAATAAVLTPDGWLRTGDVAVVDDSGYLFIVDRAKDLIIVSGFNVFPAEVEEVLLAHPDIEAAAVVGVSHPHTGEAVKAYVVVADGRSHEEDEIIDFCADHLARYKCPSKVMFVDEIPVNVAGKILRRSLR
jgi:long-chain acyl-CoA synthetase